MMSPSYVWSTTAWQKQLRQWTGVQLVTCALGLPTSCMQGPKQIAAGGHRCLWKHVFRGARFSVYRVSQGAGSQSDIAKKLIAETQEMPVEDVSRLVEPLCSHSL